MVTWTKASFCGAIIAIATMACGQTTTPATSMPATGLPEGWEEIDPRFLFLAEQLMLVENEITAITKSLAVAGYKQAVQQLAAERAEKGNERMDRRGGGPVDWWSFYGTTAEKFFYHPRGAYGTTTILVQRPSLEELGKQQTVTIISGAASARPPQFDYFYRANEGAKQRAEQAAAAIGRDVGRLLEQRHQREAKQAELWCLLSLRGVTRLELSRKPMYRFALKINGDDPSTRERQEVILHTADFIRTMNQMLTEAQDAVDWNREPETFGQMKHLIAASQHDLDQTLLKQPSLVGELEDKHSTVGMVATAAKRLIDASQNLLDAQRTIVEKERNADDLNKQRHRAILQQSIFDVAANIQTLDQCFRALAQRWNAVPDVGKGLIASPATTQRILGLTGQKAGGQLGADNLDQYLAVGDRRARLTGNARATDDGIHLGAVDDWIQIDDVTVPFQADLSAKVDSTNLRPQFGEHGVAILNWEAGFDELRLHDPRTGAAHGVRGRGRIPVKEWVHVTLVVTETSFKVLVDGQLRGEIRGDYRGLKGYLRIPYIDSAITVKSLRISQP